MAKIIVIVPKTGIVMLVLFTWVAMVASSNGKIDGKIDLVIIAPAAHYSPYMDLFKTSIQNLHNHIEMGDKKVRVAVVQPVHTGPDIDKPGGQILFNMSSNRGELENWAKNWKYTDWNAPGGRIPFWHSEAFKLADKIFNKISDKTRAKMIIQVVNGMQPVNFRQEAHDEAKKLREKGVLIYVTYDEGYDINYRDEYIDNVRAYIGINYTWRMRGNSGPHEHVFAYALQDILSLTTEITRDLCTFCKFTDKNQTGCKPDKRPNGSKIDFFGDGNARCENVNPTAIPCPMEECHYECNRQWSWVPTPPCSDQNAMPCIDNPRRSGDVPLGMENCPEEMRCNWTCPSTTTEPPPTTTPPTTESQKTTKSPKTMESPKTTESPNPTESLTEATPATEEAAEVETESPSSVMKEWWVILLMVIIVLLVLTCIVLVVISVNRKWKKKAAAAALMAKKKAAMSIPKSSDPPSTIEGDRKSRQPGQPMQFSEPGSVVDDSVGSHDGKGRPRTHMVQFGYEKAAEADHSVQVSLAMDEKARSPKKSGAKSASGKNDGVKSISPVVEKSVDTKAREILKK